MSKKETKDQALLLAAADEFLENGFQAAAMENIAKRAEVSKRTLYKYYPTKELLFNTIVERLFASAEEALVCEYDQDKSLSDLFTQILQRKFALVCDPSFLKLAKILAQEQIKRAEPDPQFIERFYEGHKTFATWVRKCQQGGKISTNYRAPEIAHWFHSIFEGMVMWPLIFGVQEVPERADVTKTSKIIIDSFLKTFSKVP